MADLEFEWDPKKARLVAVKHGVTFDEAATAFVDPYSATALDEDHSDVEDRWVTIGLTAEGRVVVVAHTERGGRIRIISARPATRPETNAYEQAKFRR
jgi:uncharacterized DUF497 family protein